MNIEVPQISVVMCVYNERLSWIKESIRSILEQTYSNFELIIIVDNPDISEQIKSYINIESQNDRRIKAIYNEANVGLAKSLNIGIACSNGKYIARMDADDISINDRLQKELNYLIETNADVVACQRIIIDEFGEKIGKSALSIRNPEITLPVSNCICHPSVIFRRDSILDINGYRAFPKSQDYDLWLRFLAAGKKIVILNEYLIKYRIHEKSISSGNRLEQYYISEYQKKLYKQRLKYGNDNFTEEGLKNYLKKKHIDKRKNDRYCFARELTDKAINSYRDRNFRFIIYFIYALFVFPEIPLKTIIAFYKFGIN